MTYQWDFDNRMAAADVGADGQVEVSYQIDALGRRIARRESKFSITCELSPPQPLTTKACGNKPSGWGGRPRPVPRSRSHIYLKISSSDRGREGPGQQTLADYPLGAAPASPMYEYVYASCIDDPVARIEPAAGQTLRFHRNQQYSIIALSDSAGTIVERYTYAAPTFLDASASPLTPPASSLDNRITYTGREWDSTLHLHHFRARMMDPQLGRFCGRDPIGYVDGFNCYYAALSINRIDPAGLSTRTVGETTDVFGRRVPILKDRNGCFCLHLEPGLPPHRVPVPCPQPVSITWKCRCQEQILRDCGVDRIEYEGTVVVQCDGLAATCCDKPCSKFIAIPWKYQKICFFTGDWGVVAPPAPPVPAGCSKSRYEDNCLKAAQVQAGACAVGCLVTEVAWPACMGACLTLVSGQYLACTARCRLCPNP